MRKLTIGYNHLNSTYWADIKDDMDTIESYVYREPDELVPMLKKKSDEGSQAAQFLWGLLSNTTYEGIMNLLNTYKDDPRASNIITELKSDVGKKWVEMVLEKVKEIQDAKQ